MLSLVGRRFAQAPTQVARAAAGAGSNLVAPPLEYNAAKIFAGEYPTHYIPAKDAREGKGGTTYRYGICSNLKSNYGPHDSNYGAVPDRSFKRIYGNIFSETAFWKRQALMIGYVSAWLVFWLSVYKWRCAKYAYFKEHPEAPKNRNFFSKCGRFFML